MMGEPEATTAEVRSSDSWVRISSEPIDVLELVAFVTAASAGGISMFLGTTRDHHSHGVSDMLREAQTLLTIG